MEAAIESPLGLESPAARADQLLRDVMGEARYQQLKSDGYLDLPSSRHAGRTYRLDGLGNLSYREPGELTYRTTLCVQPTEAIPRDDQIAMRYLLVTADEERLVKVANPITFGFMSLSRALYHDFGMHNSRPVAGLLTAGTIAFFFGALGTEAWTLLVLVARQPGVAVAVLIALLLPAFVGSIFAAAALADSVRAVQTWCARRRAAAQLRQ